MKELEIGVAQCTQPFTVLKSGLICRSVPLKSPLFVSFRFRALIVEILAVVVTPNRGRRQPSLTEQQTVK